MQHHKQIDIMFRITNSTLMDRIYPTALAYVTRQAKNDLQGDDVIM